MTNHQIIFQNANKMTSIDDEAVDLVVTSPPYPMIEMWDDIMALQNPKIKDYLSSSPSIAFELMHQELDRIWDQCYRVLKPGGFMCINIGDATRTVNGDFALYNNHTRIVKHCVDLGFNNLPNIIWRKQTNAPNKFMGSGMLPCGAYVTLEHEWILIFRKGTKREYKNEAEKKERRCSSYFWEERNQWFSDLWDLKGVKQTISNSNTRERSASYPLSLPYRIINMYSQKNDVVLDPFVGLGTTLLAAMLSERNSIGFEIDANLNNVIKDNLLHYTSEAMNNFILERYNRHLNFIRERKDAGKEVKYFNEEMECGVMTMQETEMSVHFIDTLKCTNSSNSIVGKSSLAFECTYLNDVKLSHPECAMRGLFSSSVSPSPEKTN